ncbi:hypothetical protein [Suttonella sp. R2A3]|nr:hypothetical protein [Suttonella sp. R2A3]
MKNWFKYGPWGEENAGWSYDKLVAEYQKAAQNIEIDIDESDDKK